MTCPRCGQPEEICQCPSEHDLMSFLQTFASVSRRAGEHPPGAGMQAQVAGPERSEQAGFESYPPDDPAGQPYPGEESYLADAAPNGVHWYLPSAPPSWSQDPPGPRPQAEAGAEPAPQPAAGRSPQPAAGRSPQPPAGRPPPAAGPLPPARNTMATTSLVMGVCSVLVPILSLPGLVLGVVSLRRIRRWPWLAGRGPSVAGIVTSLVLGPIGFAIFIPTFLGADRSENMGTVSSIVRSAVQAEVQAEIGTSPNLVVRCPSSEPKRAGTQFSCTVTATQTGRLITVDVRETDSRGDVIILPAATGTSSA